MKKKSKTKANYWGIFIILFLMFQLIKIGVANEANAEIKTTVEKGEVVAKETAKNAEAASKANPFYVQIGVFSDIANVKKLQIMLEGIGYKPVTEKMQTATGEKTRLRTSTFEGRNEAAIALENIKDAGLTGMVVSQK